MAGPGLLQTVPLTHPWPDSCICLQDTERKQRAQPKETPEEMAEAEAVFADF